jgi:MoxR-like ATPase
MSTSSSKVSTVDRDIAAQKPRKQITLSGDVFDRLTKGIDQLQQKAASPEDLVALYSASKALSNYVERIARDNGLQAIHVGRFSKHNGVIYIVQDSQKLRWGRATHKLACRQTCTF